jgi:hypothetical protein
MVSGAPNRFNGFSHADETVETVADALRTAITPLKRGVNETRALQADCLIPFFLNFFSS